MSQTQEFTMQPVARIRSEFAEKFGVPRQKRVSGGIGGGDRF